jgi:DNA-binding NarL/FixJ family response regulator
MASGVHSPGATTLVHIEDDPVWTEIVTRRIGLWPEVTHLGFATDGSAGLELCCKAHPDLALLNLGLPDMDGFEVARRLERLRHPPAILVLTCHCDEATLYRIGRMAIAGLIWKAHGFENHLRAALGIIQSGERYFPAEVLAALRKFRASPTAFFKMLTDQQIDLLPRFGRGDSNARIATATGLTEATIKWHRGNILAALDLHSTPELMCWAREHGFDDNLRSAPPCVSGE